MILGISASGRPDGQTAKMVKGILKASGLEYNYVSLAGKRISGCTGCLKCAGDGVCKVRDDWNEIAEAMIEAQAIVFGAPSYTFNINALGHACLERTYALRHGRYFLSGKLGVVVSPGSSGTQSEVYIRKMFEHSRMGVLCTVNGERSIAPCYECGYGHDCMAGSVVRSNEGRTVDEITPDMVPAGVDESEKTQRAIECAGWMLAKAIRKD
jgi:multimeric flavodoxin WrbA